MLDNFWNQLKSGSDIRGVATSDIKSEKMNLDNGTVKRICFAFAKWISKKLKVDYSLITVAIGHDSRVSALRMKNVSINALRDVGVNVYDCSLTSTPAMFMATSVLACNAAIQITASHHPFNRNGFKFFTVNGGVSGKDIEEILEIAQSEDFPPFASHGKVRTINLMDYYCEKLRRVIKEGINSKDEMPLKGFKIIVDAGNGAGGFFVNDVLKPLGADTDGSIFLEPDGMFPNHIPNPENDEAMKCISKATISANASLGIIFDTDVDRVAVVLTNGEEISQNRLIALSSVIALKNSKGGVIVTDSVTSDHLKVFIQSIGGIQLRYKRGYNNVISMAKTLIKKGADCPLAIESSGHAAFKENDFIDDGAFLACKIIIHMVKLFKKGQTLEDSIKTLVVAKENLVLRIPVKAKEPENYSRELLYDFQREAVDNNSFDLEKDNVDGIRVKFKFSHQKGWFLLRNSLHDPELVLFCESDVSGGVKSILNKVYPFLKRYSLLDLAELENAL